MNKAKFEQKKTVFSLLGPGLFSPCVRENISHFSHLPEIIEGFWFNFFDSISIPGNTLCTYQVFLLNEFENIRLGKCYTFCIHFSINSIVT